MGMSHVEIDAGEVKEMGTVKVGSIFMFGEGVKLCLWSDKVKW